MDPHNKIDLKPGLDTEVGDRQHLNPDGQTDAEKGMSLGGVGGALAGAAAGSLAGPLGLVAGAVIGGMAGAIASGAAVAAIDKVDGDSLTDHPQESSPEDTDPLIWATSPWAVMPYVIESQFDREAPVAPEARHDLAPLTPYYDMNEDHLTSTEVPASVVLKKNTP